MKPPTIEEQEASPPVAMIAAAVAVARRSPCAKSKRGAVVFDRLSHYVLGSGFNGRPGDLADGNCGGACRSICGHVAVHAEQRAVRAAIQLTPQLYGKLSSGLDLVHAKVVDGHLVAGGGPSCLPCSKEMLDAGVAGVWLLLAGTAAIACDACDRGERTITPPHSSVVGSRPVHAPSGALCAIGLPPVPRWRRYDMAEFHEASLADFHRKRKSQQTPPEGIAGPGAES